MVIIFSKTVSNNVCQYVLSQYVYSSDVKLTAFWSAILRKVL